MNMKPHQPSSGRVMPGHNADLILAERDRQLEEIKALERLRGRRTGFSRKAHTLLTRAWLRANWKTREELLKAATWLLYLDHLRDLSGL